MKMTLFEAIEAYMSKLGSLNNEEKADFSFWVWCCQNCIAIIDGKNMVQDLEDFALSELQDDEDAIVNLVLMVDKLAELSKFTEIELAKKLYEYDLDIYCLDELGEQVKKVIKDNGKETP